VQLLHHRPLETKWRPALEVNSLVARAVFTTNNSTSLGSGHKRSSLRHDFGRSNNLNTFMFANNCDFAKMFTVQHKRV